jgi:preprotein translocase subunit SecG
MQQLQFLQTVLLVLLILVCVSMVIVILLQRSEGGALGMGGGGGGLMTARGAGNLLTRTTAILASMFFVLSVSLTILGNYENSTTAVGRAGQTLKRNPVAAAPTAPANAAPATSLGNAANNAAGSLGDLETGAPITLKQGGLPVAPAPAAKSPPAKK